LLVEKFIRRYGIEYRDRFIRITPEALKVLERYSWPGNIRELENIIQRAIIMSDGAIDIGHLPEYLKYQIDFPDSPFKSLEEMQKEYVQRVLAHTDGNKTKAAEILQIDRKTLREKLK
jgi:DNA-binding NtrC family response regulator